MTRGGPARPGPAVAGGRGGRADRGPGAKEAASPPLTFTMGLPRSRPGDAPREDTGPPLQRQGCCASRCDSPRRAGLERWSLCGPSGRENGQAPACPARGAARPVTPCPRTSGRQGT